MSAVKFALSHPLACLAIGLDASVALAAFWPERGPGHGDHDNPNGGDWP